jgi:aerobic-type carbon monoxide dehydrogenase small subunit (CoxS/CutS family)
MTSVQPHETIAVAFTINGSAFAADVVPRRSLSDVIREDAALTGTHLGCEHGVCGACTVLVDGQPARSCLMLAVQADGTFITTVEGLADGDQLHPVQQAMVEAHGFQCAFCSPGFLMSTVALLETNPSPTRDEIRQELSGNLCRCTGYETILNGVETAVRIMNEGGAT